MNKRTAILGIDLQNDFVSPSGSLFVQNSDKDMLRIIDFIRINGSKIDYVALSLDSHQPIHIAHQCYWKDIHGNPPDLFSIISLDAVKNGEWIPQYNKEQAVSYLEQLSQQAEVCTIWPMHCILGSSGWAVHDALISALSNWSIAYDSSYELYYKGYAQNTEHYSIFKAAVEWEGQPETRLNTTLMTTLNRYDTVILVGQAADYCVVNSLKDIMDECEELARKMIVFTDCMSYIQPGNQKALNVFECAEKDYNIKFIPSTDYSI